MVEEHSTWQARLVSDLQAVLPHQHKNLDDLRKQYVKCREAKIIGAIEGNPALMESFEVFTNGALPPEHKAQFVAMYRKASDDDFFQRNAEAIDLENRHKINFNKLFNGWKSAAKASDATNNPNYTNVERKKCYLYAQSMHDSVMLINAMLHDYAEGAEQSAESKDLYHRLINDFAALYDEDKSAAEKRVIDFIETISDKKDLESIFNEAKASALSEVAQAWVEKKKAEIQALLNAVTGKPQLETASLKKFVTDMVIARMEGTKNVQPQAGSLVKSMFVVQGDAAQFQKKLNAFIDSGNAPPLPARPR